MTPLCRMALVPALLPLALGFGGVPHPMPAKMAVELIPCPVTNALIKNGCIIPDENGFIYAGQVEECLHRCCGAGLSNTLIKGFCNADECYEDTSNNPHDWGGKMWATHDVTTGIRDIVSPVPWPNLTPGTPEAALYHAKRFNYTIQAFATDGYFGAPNVMPLYHAMMQGLGDHYADRAGTPCADTPPPAWYGGMFGLLHVFSGWQYEGKPMTTTDPAMNVSVEELRSFWVDGVYPSNFKYLKCETYTSVLLPANPSKAETAQFNTCGPPQGLHPININDNNDMDENLATVTPGQC